MVISKDTKLYISVSKSPTNFGATVYNSLLQHYGIDAVYLPRLAVDNSKNLIDAIRLLGISGCSVSMPLKLSVGEYLDYLSPESKTIKSVNTIINDNGKLCGYNTDYVGIYQSLKGQPIKSALIYGSGGTCYSMVYALRQLGVSDIYLTGRTESNVIKTASDLDVEYVGEVEQIIKSGNKFDLLANVTPASSQSNSDLFSLIGVSDLIFDVVLSPGMTNFVSIASNKSKNVIDGVTMYKYQVQRQFELYFGIVPEIAQITDTLIRNKLIN